MSATHLILFIWGKLPLRTFKKYSMFTIIFIVANDEELNLLVQQDRRSRKNYKIICSLWTFFCFLLIQEKEFYRKQKNFYEKSNQVNERCPLSLIMMDKDKENKELRTGK